MTDTPHELDEADLAPPTVIVEPIAVDDLNAAQRSPFAWRVQVACVLEQPFDELHFFYPFVGGGESDTTTIVRYAARLLLIL